MRFWYVVIGTAILAFALVTTAPKSTLTTSHSVEEIADNDRLIWRIAKNDGLNCVYALLRLYRVPVNYLDLRKQIDNREPSGASLLNLRDVCNSFGLPSAVTKETPRDLAEITAPVIVHLSSHLSDGGALTILLAKQGDAFVVMHGATATIQYMSADVFFREWSGYVLRPRLDEAFSLKVFSACFVVLALYGTIQARGWLTSTFTRSN